MAPATAKKLEEKISRLERLVRAHIRQSEETDWIDDPRIVKKLDSIAKNEKAISEKDLTL